MVYDCYWKKKTVINLDITMSGECWRRERERERTDVRNVVLVTVTPLQQYGISYQYTNQFLLLAR